MKILKCQFGQNIPYPIVNHLMDIINDELAYIQHSDEPLKSANCIHNKV
jgi:hypothetical protein